MSNEDARHQYTVSVKLTEAQLNLVEAIVTELKNRTPGLSVTTSDVVRILILRGLRNFNDA